MLESGKRAGIIFLHISTCARGGINCLAVHTHWSTIDNSSSGQEYDGSDSGARPDEAVSWGKIKIDATPVKVGTGLTDQMADFSGENLEMEWRIAVIRGVWLSFAIMIWMIAYNELIYFLVSPLERQLRVIHCLMGVGRRGCFWLHVQTFWLNKYVIYTFVSIFI